MGKNNTKKPILRREGRSNNTSTVIKSKIEFSSMVIVLQIIGTHRCLIHEHKERIMGTLLCDFFGPKKIQIIVTISWLVRFGGGVPKKRRLYLHN